MITEDPAVHGDRIFRDHVASGVFPIPEKRPSATILVNPQIAEWAVIS